MRFYDQRPAPIAPPGNTATVTNHPFEMMDFEPALGYEL